jgi:hypothetical protein
LKNQKVSILGIENYFARKNRQRPVYPDDISGSTGGLNFFVSSMNLNSSKSSLNPVNQETEVKTSLSNAETQSKESIFSVGQEKTTLEESGIELEPKSPENDQNLPEKTAEDIVVRPTEIETQEAELLQEFKREIEVTYKLTKDMESSSDQLKRTIASQNSLIKSIAKEKEALKASKGKMEASTYYQKQLAIFENQNNLIQSQCEYLKNWTEQKTKTWESAIKLHVNRALSIESKLSESRSLFNSDRQLKEDRIKDLQKRLEKQIARKVELENQLLVLSRHNSQAHSSLKSENIALQNSLKEYQSKELDFQLKVSDLEIQLMENEKEINSLNSLRNSEKNNLEAQILQITTLMNQAQSETAVVRSESSKNSESTQATLQKLKAELEVAQNKSYNQSIQITQFRKLFSIVLWASILFYVFYPMVRLFCDSHHI